MTLLERVSEAQRIAAMDLREAGTIKKDKGKGADRDDDERDTGNETKIKKRPHAGGAGGKGGKGGKGGGGKGDHKKTFGKNFKKQRK